MASFPFTILSQIPIGFVTTGKRSDFSNLSAGSEMKNSILRKMRGPIGLRMDTIGLRTDTIGLPLGYDRKLRSDTCDRIAIGDRKCTPSEFDRHPINRSESDWIFERPIKSTKSYRWTGVTGKLLRPPAAVCHIQLEACWYVCYFTINK